MFDLIAGGPRHPFHKPTIAPTMVSVIGHGVVLLVAAGASFLAVGDLPEVPDMMAFVISAPAPEPPPPPPPPAKRTAAAKPQRVPAASASAAPIEAPSAIVPEIVAPWEEGIEGVAGGIEGGLVGGVVGGVLGGLLESFSPPPPPPPAPAPRAPVRIGGQLEAPALIRRVEPIYPAIAMTAHLGGTVILEATVAADGSVESVKVVRSIRFLDAAAIEAVSQWRYSPLMLNGIASPFIVTVTLTFTIKNA